MTYVWAIVFIIPSFIVMMSESAIVKIRPKGNISVGEYKWSKHPWMLKAEGSLKSTYLLVDIPWQLGLSLPDQWDHNTTLSDPTPPLELKTRDTPSYRATKPPPPAERTSNPVSRSSLWWSTWREMVVVVRPPSRLVLLISSPQLTCLHDDMVERDWSN